MPKKSNDSVLVLLPTYLDVLRILKITIPTLLKHIPIFGMDNRIIL